MEEEWRPVVGFEGIYLVSSYGRVLTINYKKTGFPRIRKIRKCDHRGKGYFKLILCKDGKRYHKTIHRLVAEAFIQNPLNKEQVNHLDGNPKNNNVNNLEWCCNQENVSHAVATGLRTNILEKHGMAKLTNKKVAVIKTLLKRGNMKGVEIAKYFNILASTVSHINVGRQWRGIKI